MEQIRIRTSAGWCNTGEFCESNFATFADAFREAPEFWDHARGRLNDANALVIVGEGPSALALEWWTARAIWRDGGDAALVAALAASEEEQAEIIRNLPPFKNFEVLP